jgi:predicted Zn-dependent protease
MLAACETLPAAKSLSDLAHIGSAAKVGQLPPLPEQRTWPDAAQDVRNQRARGYGLVEMPEMQAYLNALLAKIKQAAGVPQWPGAVYITATSELNAYCTGAGNIYLSMPWLASAESEDEVVALLAHEFGHIYMDSHQLESTIVASDQMAALALVGVAITRKAGTVTSWSPVDSLLVAYAMGKSSLAPAWSRSDEEAADRFGATISLKLNYSFSQGFKAFLERQATWEADNAARQEALQKQLLEQLKKSAADTLRASNGKLQPLERSVQDMQIGLNASLIEMTENLKQGVGEVVGKLTANHARTEDRLAALTAQVLPLIEGQPRVQATQQPWRQALVQKRTAATLKNYQKVTDAQVALQQQDFATARKLALESASAPTAQHALPLLMLSMTEAFASTDPRARRVPQRNHPAPRTLHPLDRNLQSEPDRAWRIYVTRANNLLKAGQTAQAKAVMAQGFEYFADAWAAWPEAIQFAGQTDGWEHAKKLADTCAKRFPNYASACQKAATSPAEEAAAKLRNDEKSKTLVDKWLKKTK